jgi:hypothetical protein
MNAAINPGRFSPWNKVKLNLFLLNYLISALSCLLMMNICSFLNGIDHPFPPMLRRFDMTNVQSWKLRVIFRLDTV